MKDLNRTKNLTLYFVGISVLVLALLVFLVVKFSFSAPLVNDVEVDEDSELTYYLNINYNGVDRLGVESDSNTTCEVKSGNIFVEDVIPNGLTFKRFVTTEDGTIGAVKVSDGTSCLGNVVDDTNEQSLTEGSWNQQNTEFTYHGLHYVLADNKVSFRVKNLQAGCVLTVGIVTQTPESIDDPDTVNIVETRRDFYNTANARENNLSVNSNTTHAYMGLYNATLYTVTYQYEGTVPAGATSVLPPVNSYGENAIVNVENDVNIEGYSFSGWTSNDVTISNNSFTMPASNVVLKGSFTALSTNTVTYVVNEPIPDNYETPSTKSYYPDSTVELDSMKAGDVYNGYRFLGWESEDVNLEDDSFIMPNRGVTLRGEFEVATYTVTYQFYDNVLPPNHASLLPEPGSYEEGETVTLPTIANQPGYRFLGWYHEDNFEMPAEDITISGEWATVSGEFDIEIEKEIVDEKQYYDTGDRVDFTITVTNPNNFKLTDIMVKELNDDTVYDSGTGYTITTSHYVTISELNANQSVVINAHYIMKSTDVLVTNTAKILGANAVNGYILEQGDFSSTVEFGVASKIRVCNEYSADIGRKVLFKIYNSDFETWVSLGDNECTNPILPTGTYKVKELVPQEYEIDSVTGAATEDDTSIVLGKAQTKTVNYTNQLRSEGFLHSSGTVDNQVDESLISFNRQTPGSITTGDEVCFNSECFYIVSSNANKTVLLAKYNLLVGDVYNYNGNNTPSYSLNKTLSNSDTGYGLQSSTAKGYVVGNLVQYVGTLPFSGVNYWDNSVCEYTLSSWDCTGTIQLLPEYSQNGETYYSEPHNTDYPYIYRSSMNSTAPQLSIHPTLNYNLAFNNGYTIAYYVEQYVNTIKSWGLPNTISGRLLSYEEATSIANGSSNPTKAHLYDTSYWLGSTKDYYYVWTILSDANIEESRHLGANRRGLRPVIEIPTNIINSL